MRNQVPYWLFAGVLAMSATPMLSALGQESSVLERRGASLLTTKGLVKVAACE